MKMIQPEPFTFEAGDRAVLLLHAFTGHSSDVRMLGRFLEEKNYTSHAPIYRGHGQPPEQLLKTSPKEWWEDVQKAYQYLQDLGYQEIAVAGLSLGGVLALKLAYTKNIKGLITMATPMYFDNKKELLYAFRGFAKQYKQFEQKSEDSITEEVNLLMQDAPNLMDTLEPFIEEVRANLHRIDQPTLMIQPKRDALINVESVTYIDDHISSTNKKVNWYEKSGHVVTTGVERDRLHEDVYEFLESLPWEIKKI